MRQLEVEIQELKQVVTEHDGENIADARFIRRVDELVGNFYDDIGQIRQIELKSLFDLFLLKTLYVGRRSRDAQVLDYLSNMMTGFLWARDLFPMGGDINQFLDLLAAVWDEAQGAANFPNLFEAYRKVADTSLFIIGIFPRSLGHRWRWGHRRRLAATSAIPRRYYTELGRRHYRLAANHELAEWIGQRPVLEKLSRFFEVYTEALNETSETYILGFDMNIIADKMLDCLNRYRRSRNQRDLDDAGKYAALLKVDSSNFRRFFRRRRRRYVVL